MQTLSLVSMHELKTLNEIPLSLIYAREVAKITKFFKLESPRRIAPCTNYKVCCNLGDLLFSDWGKPQISRTIVIEVCNCIPQRLAPSFFENRGQLITYLVL